jgi:hypothetical protein
MSISTCSGAGGRRCTCAFHNHRRRYSREYARRRRDQAFAGQLTTAHRCPKKTSKSTTCGSKLDTTIDLDGRTIVSCPKCERKRRGLCRGCSARVDGTIGKALWCARCRHRANLESARRSVARNHDQVLRAARAYYQTRPEVRAHRNEYKRQYRKLHPDKVREQKRRYIEKHRTDPNSAYNRYHRRYRAKYRLQKRELEIERLRVAPPARKTSPACTRCGKSTRWLPVHKGHAGRPWTVCSKCLYPGARAARKRNRRRALARAKEWLASLPKPGRIRRPPNVAVRGPGWERTCLTPGCDTVVTHRKKKCTKCRARDAQLAAAHLASVRGRRTDRERVA